MTNKEVIEILNDMSEDWSDNSHECKALKFAVNILEEMDRVKLVCANDGIIVYRVKEAENE